MELDGREGVSHPSGALGLGIPRYYAAEVPPSRAAWPPWLKVASGRSERAETPPACSRPAARPRRRAGTRRGIGRPTGPSRTAAGGAARPVGRGGGWWRRGRGAVRARQAGRGSGATKGLLCVAPRVVSNVRPPTPSGAYRSPAPCAGAEPESARDGHANLQRRKTSQSEQRHASGDGLADG